MSLRYFLAAALAIAGFSATGARAAESVTTTVTAVGKKNSQPPPVKKEDVELYQGRERMQVANWRRGETLFLAVLIDDSLDQTIASQWNDLRAFFMAQPPTTYIGVFYGRNGTAMVAQDFTKDHRAGRQGATNTATADMARSPARTCSCRIWSSACPGAGERRSILLISSGIDYFRGNFGPYQPGPGSHHRKRAERQHQHLDFVRSGCRSWRAWIFSRFECTIPTEPAFRRDRSGILLPRDSELPSLSEAISTKSPLTSTTNIC